MTEQNLTGLKRIRKLTVLYDADCGFCERCRRWLAAQPAFIEMEFLALGSAEARRRFPGMPPRELIAVTDTGLVYRDTNAWIVCLWALRRFRGLAKTLARPGLRHLARRAYYALAIHRYDISRRLGMSPTRATLLRIGEAPDPPACRRDADFGRRLRALPDMGEFAPARELDPRRPGPARRKAKRTGFHPS